MKILFMIIFTTIFTSCSTTTIEKENPGADIIIHNAKVWTGSATDFKNFIVIRGEKISFIGDDDALLEFSDENTQLIDAKGKLVLPGFIDSHTHFISGGFQLKSVDLRQAFSRQEFVALLSQKAESMEMDSWITGGDWDHQQFPDKALPEAVWIDSGTKNVFVFVTRHDGHMGVANSRALELAGITNQTPDPPGGTIVRNPNTGEPTGILKDAAMNLMWKVIPDRTIEERKEAALTAMRHASEMGVTSIHDMGAWDDLTAYTGLEEESNLSLRVNFYAPIYRINDVLDSNRNKFPSSSLLKLNGFKAFVDGSLGSSTAYFFEPFSDDPANSGLLDTQMLPLGKMNRRVMRADSAGWQLAIHAIGDRANSMILDIYEETIKTNGKRESRFRIEHAQHIAPPDFPRYSDNDIIAAVQPFHAIDDGRWAVEKIGYERGKTTYAFRTFLDSGINVAFGSDWTVAPLNPLQGIYAAVTRRTTDGANPDGWYPEQKITLNEALLAYTSGAAYAAFNENLTGTIEIGKYADLVILNEDLFRIQPENINKALVAVTIFNGKVIFERL